MPEAQLAAARFAVVEDDDAVRSFIESALKGLSATTIGVFGDGEEAWSATATADVDCFILDWKMPKLTGAGLLCRLRGSARHQYTPVLVVSGFIGGRDFSLVEDFPFTDTLEKPFALPVFGAKLRLLLQERAWFETSRKPLELLFQQIDAGTVAFTSVWEKIKTAPRVAPLGLALARALMARGRFEDAEVVLRELVKVAPTCGVALNELGKVLLRQRRFGDAMAVLSEAQAKSPENVERLCLLGDVSLNQLQPEEAKAYFNQALAIDRADVKAQAGNELAGSLESYLAAAKVERLPGSLASLLNAVGIAMVRSQKIDAGIHHYRSALHYVHDAGDRARLAFNLGLGYLRGKRPDEALPWFEQAATAPGPSAEKASGYVQRLKARGAGSARTGDAAQVIIEEASEGGGQTVITTTSGPVEEPAGPGAIDFEMGEPPAQRAPVALAFAPLLEEDDDTSAEPPTTLFNQLQAIIGKLRFPDESLMTKAGMTALRKSHESYAATLGDTKLCVLLPKTHSPHQIASISDTDAKRLGITVLRDAGDHWEPLWPVEKAA